MKNIITIALILSSVIFMVHTYAGTEPVESSSSAIAEKTVTFTIEKMTCKTCPITVRKAMSKVDGVVKVTTNYEARTATAVFDPSKTNAQAIGDASTNAGYPAKEIN